MFKEGKKTVAQSVLEYTMIMALVAVAIIGMTRYVFRGIRGATKSWEDQINDSLSEQFYAATGGPIGTTGSYQTNQWGGSDEARCYDGDVAIGYFDSGNDEVHCAKLVLPEDLCAEVTGTYQTENDPEWMPPPIRGDSATCNSGDVAIGYYDPTWGGDQVHCARLALTSCGPGQPEPDPSLCIKTTGIYTTTRWGEYPNGGHNEARCYDGDVMIGYIDVGDDMAICAKLTVGPCG